MQMIRCALLIIGICFSVFVQGQQKRLDSLLQVHRSYQTQDSLKVIHYRNLFRQYGTMRKYPQVMLYVDSSVVLAERLKKYSLMVVLYESAGRIFHGTSQFFEALSYYQKAYETAQKYNNPRGEAAILLNLGALYMDVKDYAKSLETLQLAIKQNEKLGIMDNVVSSYMNIALVYIELNQIAEAFPYLTKALTAFEADDPQGRGVAIASQALATAYMKATEKELSIMGVAPAKRYSLALAALNKALPITFAVDDLPSAATINSDIADIYEASGDKEKARFHFKKALEIDRQHESDAVTADNFLRIGMHYLRSKDRVNGLLSMQKGVTLAETCKSLATLRTGYEQLSRYYEEENKFDSALAYHKKFIVIRDSIYGAEKEKEISLRQLSLNYELKERDYNYSKQLVDNELKQQVLLAEQRKNQLALAEKEKSVQRLLFLQQQATMESEAKHQASAFQIQKDRSAYESAIAQKQISNQRLELRYNRNLNLFFLIAVLVLLAGGGIVFYNQRKTKKLNAIISDQKLELEELNSVKDKVLGTLSHDMRTPINSLISFTHLLEKDNIPQDRLKLYAAQLKSTLGYTQGLMDNLLKWATSQMHGFTPDITSIALHDITEQVLYTLTDHLKQKDISIHNSILKGSVVLADREMLASVIRNLLTNAIKFSHKSGTIYIASERGTGNQLLKIRDEGIGMSADKVASINHDQGKTVKSSKGTGEEKGNGLGLVLCKSFVQMMNGHIKVRSEVNNGSTFTIKLPAANDKV